MQETPETERRPLRIALEVVCLALLYAFVARVSFVFELPPSDIRALVPAGGLALAAVVLRGWPMLVGVFVGSFAQNFATYSGSTRDALAVAVAIACAAALQAWLGSFVLRTFVGELPPRRVKLLAGSIALLALTSAVMPAIRVSALCLSGYEPWAHAWTLIWTVWLGTYVGILFVAPGLIVLARRRHKALEEAIAWPLASAMVGLALFGFVMRWNYDEQALGRNLRSDSSEMMRAIETEEAQFGSSVLAVQSLYESSAQVEREEFSSFVKPLMARSPRQHAVAWAARVPAADRERFEQAIRAEPGFADFRIFDLDANGRPTTSGSRAEYFPVTYCEPLERTRGTLGFDLVSERARRDAINRARDTGEAAVSGRIRLWLVGSGPDNFLVAAPIYRHGAPRGTLEERRANLLGVTCAVFSAEDLLGGSVAGLTPHDIELYLFDVSEPSAQFLAFRPSITGPQELTPGLTPDPESLALELSYSRKLNLYGRSWLVIARPGPGYVRESRGAGALVRLLAGLFAAAVFLVYMEARQRAERLLREAEKRYRTLLEQSPAIVYLDEIGGDWRYVGPKIESILGYTPEDFTERRAKWLECVHPDDRDRVIGATRSSLVEGAMIALEYRMTARSGREVWIRDEAQVSRETPTGAWLLRGVMTDVTERKRAELERQALFEIMQRLVTAPAPRAFAELARASLASVLHAENFFVLLHDPTTGLFDVIYAVDQHGEVPSRLELGRGLAAHVFRTGEALIVTPELFEALQARGDVELLGVNSPSWLGAPMKTGERVIGVIAVQDYESAGRYSERDREFLASVAAQMALAIERHQAAETLRKSESRYRLVSENAADAVWTLDVESRRFTYVSPSVARLCGFTSDELLDKGLDQILTPDSFEKAMRLMAERPRIPGLEPNVDELDQYRRDGSVITTEVTTSYAVDDAGKLQVIGVSRDITERKRTDRLLRESRANLELAQQVARLGSWELDVATGEGHWSAEMFRLFDRDPAAGVPALDDFLGKVHPDDHAEFLEAQMRAIDLGERSKVEYRAVLAGSDVRYLETTLFPLKSAEGKVVRLAGTVLDVSERKRAELEREALLEILQSMAVAPDTPTFLSQAHAALKRVIHAENVSVIVRDPDTGLYEQLYFVDERHLEPFSPVPAVRGRAGHVFRSNRAVVFTPALFAELLAKGELEQGETTPASWMGAPLRSGTRSLGVVIVQDYETPDLYGESDRVFFASVASQIALAIERRQAQTALVQNAARLSEAERISHIGVWELDVRRNHLTWSDEIYRIFGIEPQASVATYEAFLDSIHPDDRELVNNAYRESLAHQEPYQIEHRLLLKNGDVKYVREHCESWFDEEGTPLRSVGTVQDITAARNATAEIIRLSHVVEQTGDAVLITDVEGTIEYVNPAFERQYGYSLEEVIGKTPRILKSGVESPEIYERMWATILRGETFESELCNARKDGQHIYVAQTITPIRDEHGTITRFVATGKDVTARKAMEDALQERLKELTCQRCVQELLETNPRLDDLCREVAANLVAAMKFPELAIATVELGGSRFTSASAGAVAVHGLTAAIELGGRSQGRVSVQYTEAKPFTLPEEQQLLDAVASSMGLWFERQQSETALRASEHRFRYIFESTGIGLWEQDFSGVWAAIDRLRDAGVGDVRQYLAEHPELVRETAETVRVLHVNRAGLRMHRIPEGADLTQTFGKIMSSVGLDVFAEEMATLAEGQRYYEAETVNQTIDGELIDVWLSLSVPPTSRESVLVSTIDITTRKRAENALREATALYQTVFDVSLDGLAVFDERFNITLINRRGAEMYGFASPDELLGVNIAQLAAPGIRERVVREAGEQLASSVVAHGEILALRRDGSTFPAEYALIRLPADELRAQGLVVGVTRDITARQREAILKTTQFSVTRTLIEARSLVEVVPSLLQTLCEGTGWDAGDLWLREGDDDRELRWISGWCATGKGLEGFAAQNRDLGLSSGRYFLRRLKAEETTVWVEDTAATDFPRSPLGVRLDIRSVAAIPVRAEGEIIGMIVLIARPVRPVEPDLLPVFDSVGRQLGLFAARRRAIEELAEERNSLASRVTERTAELSRVNAELGQAVRTKDEFLANMSHELRTPLNAILALSESLLEQLRGPLNERQQASLRTIEASGRHLLSLITDILDLSKVEAGRMELQLEPVPLVEVCEASLVFVREMAAKKQLQLAFSLDDQLARIEADPKRLKQMLVNLLSNAVKFTPKGGQVSLEVETDPELGVVRLAVRDNGVGIAREDLARLFQPFTQIDSSLSRHHEGTGLGLALVRRLAELHGGMVSVESEPGRGSVFTIALPYAPAEVVADARHQTAVTEPQALIVAAVPYDEPAPAKARILLAEDTEANIMAIGDYLVDSGYELTVARNGVEALEQAAETKPDLILMDIQMPKMDGLEATRRLRAMAEFARVPIVALTGLAMPGDRERCLEAGASEYLTKPVSPRALVTVIERFLNVRSAAPSD